MPNVKMKTRKKLSEEGNIVLKEMLTSQLINFGPFSKSSDQSDNAYPEVDGRRNRNELKQIK